MLSLFFIVPLIRLAQGSSLSALNSLADDKILNIDMSEVILRRIFENSDKDRARIVGGQNSDGVPYQGSLFYSPNNQHYCGCSLLSVRYCLTAAHCLDTSDEIRKNTKLRLGSNRPTKGGDVYKIAKFIKHEKYIKRPIFNDIGLIQTESDVKLTSNVALISLPTKEVEPKTIALASGFGYVNSNKKLPEYLQEVNLTVISITDCMKQFNGTDVEYNKNIDERNVCTFIKYGLGICQGDSGGPLAIDSDSSGSKTVQKVVVGAASFNIPCARGFPDAFTSVFYFREWIKDHMK